MVVLLLFCFVSWLVCFVFLRFALLCFALLYFALLCFALLYFALLCFDLLWFALFFSKSKSLVDDIDADVTLCYVNNEFHRVSYTYFIGWAFIHRRPSSIQVINLSY